MRNGIIHLKSWHQRWSREVLPSERMDRARALRRFGNLTILSLFSLVGGAAEWWIASHKPPMFKATAVVRLEMNPLRGRGRLPKRLLEDEIAIMTSKAGLKAAVDALSAEDRLKLLHQAAGRVRKKNSASAEDRMGAVLGLGLSAKRVPKTNTLAVSFVNPDPQLAANVANAEVSAMTLVNLDYARQHTERAEAFLDGPLKSLQDEVRISQLREGSLTKTLLSSTERPETTMSPLNTMPNARSSRKGKRTDTSFDETSLYSDETFTDPEYGSEAAMLRFFRLESNQAQREKQRTALQAQMLADMYERNRAIFDGGAGEPSEAMTKAVSRYDSLAVTLAANHPDMVAERSEVEILRAEDSALHTRQLEAAEKQASVSGEVAAQLKEVNREEQRRVASILDRQRRNSVLYEDFAIDEVVLQRLEAKLKSARIETSLNGAVVEEVSPAMTPYQPISKQIPGQVIKGMGLGFLCALCIAFASLLRSYSLWTIDELEEMVDRPVFAVLTQVKGALRLQHGALSHKELEEELSLLREFITHFPSKQSGLRLLFTSTLPREGKTTVTAVFAACLARAGRAVLVVDANLHRPSLHKAFRLDGRVGLSHVLEGRVELEEAVQAVNDLPSLHVLAAGPTPPDPTSLLVSSSLRDMLRAASQRYDYVLIDSPPTKEFSDALYIASLSHVVFYVAKYGLVQRHSTAEMFRKVSGANLLSSGLIVNGAPGAAA